MKNKFNFLFITFFLTLYSFTILSCSQIINNSGSIDFTLPEKSINKVVGESFKKFTVILKSKDGTIIYENYNASKNVIIKNIPIGIYILSVETSDKKFGGQEEVVVAGGKTSQVDIKLKSKESGNGDDSGSGGNPGEGGTGGDVTPEVPDVPTEVIIGSVNLTVNPTSVTNKNVTVTVGISNPISEIKTIKWVKGKQTESYFVSGGTVIQKNSLTFSADENGDYTVFVESTTGNKKVQSINITNIDKTGPAAVTALKGTFDFASKKVTLTWENPVDSDYKEVKITEGSTTQTVTKTAKTVDFTIQPDDMAHTFTAITYDELGNEGKTGTCEVTCYKYVAGDVIFKDGTKKLYSAVTASEKANAVAVVCGFNINGQPLGVGLQESDKIAWAPNPSFGRDKKFDSILSTKTSSNLSKGDITTDSDKDGSNNWDEVKKADTNVQKDYPAFKYAESYGTTAGLTGTDYSTGWYIPTMYEFCEMHENETVITSALSKVSGTAMVGPYWTSSQDGDTIKAWAAVWNSNSISPISKDFLKNVRCIHIIK